MITKKTIYRDTKQRKEILDLLKSTTNHLTAENIHKRLKKKFKHLSLGTVYRNLRILKERNLIWELDFGGGFSIFDGLTSPHYHFICNSCQKVFNIRIPAIRELDYKVRELTGFQVDHHRLEFFGLCDICKKRLRKKE
jgi:Fe2+ or Zn2+ uptake regulation protein